MPADMDAPLTRDLAATAAGVDPSVISMWAYRGWIDPDTGERRKLEVVGRDWRNRPQYRHGDVMAAERATRRSGKSHRRPASGAQSWAALDVNQPQMRYAS